MIINPSQVKQANGLFESTYLTFVVACARYAKFILEQGGVYSLVCLPFIEFIRAVLYWQKVRSPSFHDSPLKKWSNLTFNAIKVMATTVGVGFAVSGMLAIGFAVMITLGYINVLRSLGKAARSAMAGEPRKVSNQLHKAIVGSLISVGFTLMTFIPPLAWLGGLFALIGTSHIMISILPEVLGCVPMTDTRVVRTLSLIQDRDERSSLPTIWDDDTNSIQHQPDGNFRRPLLP